MQKQIIKHCNERGLTPIITTDHNLVYKKDEKLFICNYKGAEFGYEVEVKDVEMLCNGIMKYLKEDDYV